MGKNVYSSETKWAVVREKMSGQLTTKETMEKHGIKNKSKIETWMRWYRANELNRFDQPIGKQYSFGMDRNLKPRPCEQHSSKIQQTRIRNPLKPEMGRIPFAFSWPIANSHKCFLHRDKMEPLKEICSSKYKADFFGIYTGLNSGLLKK